MIRKLFIVILSLSISSCGGFTKVAGLKFKKEVGAETNGGNASFTEDVIKLRNNIIVGFKRPIGKCGAGVTFFGIILPIIPVLINLNSCEESFDISISGLAISSAKLKYNSVIYDPVVIEKLIEPYKTQYEYGKKFKFKILNFWDFRMANDKAIIIIGKTKDGKEFIEELPVKWGVMTYYNWSFP
jgi:hypothetical protein